MITPVFYIEISCRSDFWRLSNAIISLIRDIYQKAKQTAAPLTCPAQFAMKIKMIYYDTLKSLRFSMLTSYNKKVMAAKLCWSSKRRYFANIWHVMRKPDKKKHFQDPLNARFWWKHKENTFNYHRKPHWRVHPENTFRRSERGFVIDLQSREWPQRYTAVIITKKVW